MRANRIDLHYFSMAVDMPHAHLIRIRWSTAPGQAKNLRHALAGIRLHARVERHNLVVLDTLEAVAGLLLRLAPTLLLQQDLEELLAADRAIVMGRRATPEQLTRRAQAVRAVLARLPPMPEDRKRRPRRKPAPAQAPASPAPNVGAQ